MNRPFDTTERWIFEATVLVKIAQGLAGKILIRCTDDFSLVYSQKEEDETKKNEPAGCPGLHFGASAEKEPRRLAHFRYSSNVTS